MTPMNDDVKQENRNTGPAGGAGGTGSAPAANAGGNSLFGWWLIPVLVALIGAFMSILDSSIVNVAIPTIMNVFNANTSTVEWVVTIYMLAMGVVMPLSGWLGDKLGFKRLYILSMAGVCNWFITVRPELEHQHPDRRPGAPGPGRGHDHAHHHGHDLSDGAQGADWRSDGHLWHRPAGSPGDGPHPGRLLVEYVDWRWIFTINLPIGVIGILLSLFLLPEFQTREAGSLDIGGALTSAAGLFCLLLALSKGNGLGLAFGSDRAPVLYQRRSAFCCSSTWN